MPTDKDRKASREEFAGARASGQRVRAAPRKSPLQPADLSGDPAGSGHHDEAPVGDWQPMQPPRIDRAG